MAPVVHGEKGEHKDLFDKLRKDGYARIVVDDKDYDLSETIELDKNKKHDLSVVVDRIILKDGIEERLAQSFEKALDLVVKVNGTIVFCENMNVSAVLSNFTNLVVRSNVGESYTIKRKDSKNVFVITNGSTVTIKNLGLGGGVEVGFNNNLDLNNVTVTITDSESGGIVYNTSSSGNIVNSNFTGSKNIDHALTVNGNNSNINTIYLLIFIISNDLPTIK